MAMTVGADAPDFTLKNQDKGEVTLSSFRGKQNVVLGFYVYDFSPICERENACFTSDLPKISDAGTVVFGVSRDSTWSHKAFREKMGYKHDLLADVGCKVAKAYGLYQEPLDAAVRSTVVVDKHGKVAFVKIHDGQRDDAEILAVLARLR